MEKWVELELIAKRRWSFWPAFLVIVTFGRLGILKDVDKAGTWLADHAMRVEARPRYGRKK